MATFSKTPPLNPRRPWAELTCPACNEKFYIIRSLVGMRVTCSAACKKAHRDATWETITCLQCKSEAKARKIDGAKFCSFACSRRYLKGENHALWVSNREKKCLHCGGVFARYLKKEDGRELYSEKKFCSVGCRIEHGRIHTDMPVGTVSIYGDGYKMVKLGPKKWVPEHRHIMEQVLGRPLLKEELVHHRYGDPQDNDPDHLMVTSGFSEHQKIHYWAERHGLRDMWVHPIEGIEL